MKGREQKTWNKGRGNVGKEEKEKVTTMAVTNNAEQGGKAKANGGIEREKK